MSSPKDFEDFSASVEALFPGDENKLRRFYRSSRGIPLGYEHTGMLAELCDVKLDSAGFKELTLGYVLLSSYYFLLDAVVDGHLEDVTDSVYLTQLLAGALGKIDEAASLANPTIRPKLRPLIFAHISQNAEAICTEKRLHAEPFELAIEDERRSIIGRSNSALLLYELIAEIYSCEPTRESRIILEDIVYYLQLGDDLSDWREDFRASRRTLFLRRCVGGIGALPTERALEEFVYLSGFYEEWAGDIVGGLSSISTLLHGRRPQPTGLISLVDSQRMDLENALRDWIAAKLYAARG